MEQYISGKEDIMLQNMEASWGVNPTKPWLIEFYKEHNPKKLDQNHQHHVDLLLDRYKGQEDYLFFKLSMKYLSSTVDAKEEDQKASACDQKPSSAKVEQEKNNDSKHDKDKNGKTEKGQKQSAEAERKLLAIENYWRRRNQKSSAKVKQQKKNNYNEKGATTFGDTDSYSSTLNSNPDTTIDTDPIIKRLFDRSRPFRTSLHQSIFAMARDRKKLRLRILSRPRELADIEEDIKEENQNPFEDFEEEDQKPSAEDRTENEYEDQKSSTEDNVEDGEHNCKQSARVEEEQKKEINSDNEEEAIPAGDGRFAAATTTFASIDQNGPY